MEPMATLLNKLTQDAKNGGFTYGMTVGGFVTNGYMVSTVKNAEQVVPVAELTEDIIAGYILDHLDELTTSGNCLGAWLHEGNVYLDISQRVDTLDAAIALGIEHNQIGVYDLAKFETILTGYKAE